jgi:hypothetical protein
MINAYTILIGGSSPMLTNLTVAGLQLAALAVLIVLWHFWVKRKLEGPRGPDDAKHTLPPFGHLCRLLLGLVFLTSLVQVYLQWESSTLREHIASTTTPGKKQEQNIRVINELKGMIENLRKEAAGNSKVLHAMKTERGSGVQAGLQNPSGLRVPAGGLLEGRPRLSSQAGKTGSAEGGFAKEAKASSIARGHKAIEKRFETQADTSEQVYSMRLNRQGHVTTEKLRVRKRPQQNSEVVEKLLDGQQVKVTEKRLHNDTMWFRVITPSGRAGWVDFRYLTLDGGA